MTLKIKAREGCLWRHKASSVWCIMIKFDTKNDIVVYKLLSYDGFYKLLSYDRFYPQKLPITRSITSSIFNGQNEDEYEVIYPCKLMKLMYGIE